MSRKRRKREKKRKQMKSKRKEMTTDISVKEKECGKHTKRKDKKK